MEKSILITDTVYINDPLLKLTHSRLKKIAFIFLAFTSLFIMLVLPLKAEQYDWPVLDIDLSSCLPSGPISKSKEWLDPKSFWIHQHNLLENAIQEDKNNYIDNVPECYDKHKGDVASTQRCVGYYQNRTNSIRKCFSFSIRMCRSNGGYC